MHEKNLPDDAITDLHIAAGFNGQKALATLDTVEFASGVNGGGTPVVVKESALPAQLTSSLRALLLALGAYAVGRGWIDDGLLQAIVPVVLIIAPLIWSQVSARRKQAQLVTLAQRVPDSVAKVV